MAGRPRRKARRAAIAAELAAAQNPSVAEDVALTPNGAPDPATLPVPDEDDNPRSRESINARRDLVRQLLVRRMSPLEISNLLNQRPDAPKTSVETVKRDIEALKLVSRDELDRQTVTDIVADVLSQSRVLDREAWKLFYATRDPMVRLSAMQFLRQNRQDTVRTLQSLGAVYEEPKKIQMRAEVRLIDKLRELPPELASELAQIRDHPTFLKRLRDIFGAQMVDELNVGGQEEVKALGTGSVSIEEASMHRGEV